MWQQSACTHICGCVRSQRGYGDRKKPDWTPPGPAFAVIWSTIAGLRATAGLLIWQTCGKTLLAFPLLAFCTHLSIGDTWNHVNNIQKRMGFGLVLAWGGVYTSVVAVVLIYFMYNTTAGWVLLPSALWLTVAQKLIFDIWRLNGRVCFPVCGPNSLHATSLPRSACNGSCSE